MLLTTLLTLLTSRALRPSSLNPHRWIFSTSISSEPRSPSSDLASCCPVADTLEGRCPGFEEVFLSQYWQKKPLLIRNFVSSVLDKISVSPSMLLDLCLEEDVESRIVAQMRGKLRKKSGPFRPVDIEHLQPKNWTLLVQEVDRHVPAIADLWDEFFGFIPSWRRDDVMVSYAREGGGIGAHVDNYDVFLLQARGRRRWSLENAFLTESAELEREVPGAQTRLLRDFAADQSWELSAGDVLYLPPRVPHQGVSLDDDCITISMGFRAPSHISLCSAFVEHVCSGLSAVDMYTDPDLTLQTNVGQVSAKAVGRLQRTIGSELIDGLDDRDFNTWLGCYLTTPLRQKPPTRAFFLASDDPSSDSAADGEDDLEEEPLYVRGPHSVASRRSFGCPEEVLAGLREGSLALRRAEGTRVACIGDELFIDGEAFRLPPSSSEQLGRLLSRAAVDTEQLVQVLGDTEGEGESVLVELLGRGLLYPVDR